MEKVEFEINIEGIKTKNDVKELLKILYFRWVYYIGQSPDNMKIPEDILDLEKRKIIKRV